MSTDSFNCWVKTLKNRLNTWTEPYATFPFVDYFYITALPAPLIWLISVDWCSKTKKQSQTTQCSMILSFHVAVCSCFLYNSNEVSSARVCPANTIQPHWGFYNQTVSLLAHMLPLYFATNPPLWGPFTFIGLKSHNTPKPAMWEDDVIIQVVSEL